ncbi:MAG: hypothetical protein BWK78_00645 [Thiotrichaceae bacterium IS1]|nr:MAG: hypothetical protein BWK78_00645 [Thiotrichaceae bacterium IS1]
MNIRETIDGVLRQRQKKAPLLEKIHQGFSELNLRLRNMQQMASQNVPEDFAELTVKLVTGLQNVEAEMNQLSNSVANVAKRFSRQTINIGVAGTARQGKSTLLQKISNLTDKEIPTSSDLPCTGTKSRIYHSELHPHAQIEFYTKQEFLTEIIYPYFDRLSFRRPFSLEEFAKPLPEFLAPEGTQEINTLYAVYGELTRIHSAFPTFSDLLSKPPLEVTLEEVRNYVTQRDLEGKSLTTYLAVKAANIYNKFPNHDVTGLCLVDLPGLEAAQGHEKKLVASLEQEVDAVILIKFPKANGDQWTIDDYKVINLINNAVTEIDLANWLFIVLNESNLGENQNIVQLLRENPPRTYNTKPMILKANCYDAQEVDEQVFSKVLKHLEQNLGNIDQQHIKILAQKMDSILMTLKQMLEHARSSFTLPEGDMTEFLDLFEEFMNELREGLQELVSEQREMTSKEGKLKDGFKLKVEEVCNFAKEKPSILPDNKELEKQCKRKAGWLDVLPPHLNQLRAYLTRYLAENLDAYLKSTVDEVLAKALNRMFPASLNNLVILDSNHEQDPRSTIQALQKLLDKNKQPNLYSAFEYIVRFNFSYHSLFHYRVRSVMTLLDSFEGDAIFQLTAGATRDNIPQKSEEIATGLNKFYQDTIFQVSKKLGEDMQADPASAIFALVEEIQDRLAQTKGIDKEWRGFLYPLRGRVWPEKFKVLADKESFCQDWRTMIDDTLKSAQQVQSDFRSVQ